MSAIYIMKGTISVFTLAITAAAFAGQNDVSLKCGVAETVITRVKDRQEVYGELNARALVFAAANQRAALVTLDIGTLGNDYAKDLLKGISNATGIPAENLLINPSHTHNAPGVDGRNMSPESRTWLAGVLAELVASAAGHLEPTTLRYGRAPVQVGFNRRLMVDGHVTMEPNRQGAVVPWVDVLAVHGLKGKRIAVLFSHAAHPVIVHRSSGTTGPDYPGFAVTHLRRLLSTKDGEAVGIFMFAQGCGANINGYPLNGGLDKCETAGLSLATAVVQALANAKEIASGSPTVRSTTLSLPLQNPPPLAECKANLANQPDNQRYQGLLKLVESGQPQFKPLPVRALAIGDLCIVGFAGEMFAEYQLWLDQASPFKHTFALSYTNGYAGYIGTADDYKLGPAGGYETWEFPTGNPPWLPLRPAAETQVRDGVLKLLTGLKSQATSRDGRPLSDQPEPATK
ncbi:MAG: hypothetical protein NTW21_02695 [Verrucomicrobia bacterium]|nr:hypothetical protein [Verrucomicrobiota bacterium]